MELRYRTGLLASLYREGDQESLDMALKSTDEAYRADEGSEYEHYRHNSEKTHTTLEIMFMHALNKGKFEDAKEISKHRHNSEKTHTALEIMFMHALNEGKFEDAKEISKHYNDEAEQPTLLIRRAIAGDPEVTFEEVDEALSTFPKRKGLTRLSGVVNKLINGLARIGHEPSIKEAEKNVKRLEKRINNRFRKPLDRWWETSYLYEALYSLHEAGDPTAKERLEELARSDENFGCTPASARHYLREVGADPIEFARLAYKNDPNVQSRDELLDVEFSKELFQEQVEEEIKRLQSSQTSWMGRLIIKTAKKAASRTDVADTTFF